MSGFRQWDNSGNLIIDSTQGSIGKLIGEFYVDGGSGSFSDNSITSGIPFVVPKTTASTSNGDISPNFVFSGNTISWSPPAGGSYSPRTYLYGSGIANNTNYPSRHVSGNGGFIVRDEAGRFVLDETFFSYHYIGYKDVSVVNGVGPIDIPYPSNNLPLIANRGGVSIAVISYQTLDASNTRLIVKSNGSTTIRLMFFDKASRTSIGSGNSGHKWWDNSGNLMGDTSVPFMRVYSTQQFTTWSNAETNYMPAGRNYAVCINVTGARYTQVVGGQGGSGAGSAYVSGGRINNIGSSEVVTVEPLLLSGPGGGSEIGKTPGQYTIIDVTGLV